MAGAGRCPSPLDHPKCRSPRLAAADQAPTTRAGPEDAGRLRLEDMPVAAIARVPRVDAHDVEARVVMLAVARRRPMVVDAAVAIALGTGAPQKDESAVRARLDAVLLLGPIPPLIFTTRAIYVSSNAIASSTVRTRAKIGKTRSMKNSFTPSLVDRQASRRSIRFRSWSRAA